MRVMMHSTAPARARLPPHANARVVYWMPERDCLQPNPQNLRRSKLAHCMHGQGLGRYNEPRMKTRIQSSREEGTKVALHQVGANAQSRNAAPQNLGEEYSRGSKKNSILRTTVPALSMAPTRERVIPSTSPPTTSHPSSLCGKPPDEPLQLHAPRPPHSPDMSTRECLSTRRSISLHSSDPLLRRQGGRGSRYVLSTAHFPAPSQTSSRLPLLHVSASRQPCTP